MKRQLGHSDKCGTISKILNQNGRVQNVSENHRTAADPWIYKK